MQGKHIGGPLNAEAKAGPAQHVQYADSVRSFGLARVERGVVVVVVAAVAVAAGAANDALVFRAYLIGYIKI
jgi:hypothetical protein